MKHTLCLCVCAFWMTLMADLEGGAATYESDYKDYLEPWVKPKILEIEQAPVTNSPVQLKRYYRRNKMSEKRKFTIQKTQISTLPPIPGYTSDNQEVRGNNFGADAEIYFCKRSPGKRTSENRMCQINKTQKCQCVRSECKYFKTFAQKELYRCVKEDPKDVRQMKGNPRSPRVQNGVSMDPMSANLSAVGSILADDITTPRPYYKI